MQHIRKMHCQHFILKYITLDCSIVQAKPVLSPGLISLHYSEFVSNKHSTIPSVSGLSVAIEPRNNVPAGPPLIGPGLNRIQPHKKCWGCCLSCTYFGGTRYSSERLYETGKTWWIPMSDLHYLLVNFQQNEQKFFDNMLNNCFSIQHLPKNEAKSLALETICENAT